MTNPIRIYPDMPFGILDWDCPHCYPSYQQDCDDVRCLCHLDYTDDCEARHENDFSLCPGAEKLSQPCPVCQLLWRKKGQLLKMPDGAIICENCHEFYQNDQALALSRQEVFDEE